MALTVDKLNADTSFLLTFTPDLAPTGHARPFPGAVTVILDPWLNGSSCMWHPAFQISHHTSKCSVSSLAEMSTPPDMVVISQDKPDHCHKATLCSIPPHWPTIILAPPAAAKRILAWRHFDPSRVRVLEPYRRSKPATVFRHAIAPYTSSSSPGELTIAHIPTKRDVTGLHTALGITYRAPGALLTAVDGTLTHLSEMSSPTPKLHQIRSMASEKRLNHIPCLGSDYDLNNGLPTPPSTAGSSQSSLYPATSPDSRTYKERTLSVIYTPHGVSSQVLQPYVENHLRSNAANPPLALFHSFNSETNPWFMGGLVVAGAPNGCRLAKELRVKHWFGAHDEVKDSRGVAVSFCKSQRYDLNDISEMLRQNDDYDATTIHMPEVGESVRIA